jgi:CheY-like chemotaxis protein
VPQEELLETIYRVMSRPSGNGPAAIRPAPAQEPAALPGSAPPQLHILLAEDDEFSARFMEQLLTRGGHRVRVATSGREAVLLATDGVFDQLLLDIHLPELDGFGVVGAIRERERATGGHVPVIALTARSRKEDRERCLAAGMDVLPWAAAPSSRRPTQTTRSEVFAAPFLVLDAPRSVPAGLDRPGDWARSPRRLQSRPGWRRLRAELAGSVAEAARLAGPGATSGAGPQAAAHWPWDWAAGGPG